MLANIDRAILNDNQETRCIRRHEKNKRGEKKDLSDQNTPSAAWRASEWLYANSEVLQIRVDE